MITILKLRATQHIHQLSYCEKRFEDSMISRNWPPRNSDLAALDYLFEIISLSK